MKNALLPVYLFIAAALVAAFAISCLSQPQFDAGRELAQAAVTATDPASPGGAAVTTDEEAYLKLAYERLRGAEGYDWGQLGTSVLASLAAVFPALRLLPSRLFLGTAPDPDVQRAAGLPVLRAAGPPVPG